MPVEGVSLAAMDPGLLRAGNAEIGDARAVLAARGQETLDAAGGAAEPAVTASKQFTAALRVSSAYYNKFAYSIAGDGAQVDYHDPTVISNNVDGRTALRKSAAEALIASGTPGLQPEIAAPMRAWSLRATKLLMVMGLRLDGNTLNDAATALNADANDAQMACVTARAQPLIRGAKVQP